MDRETVENQRGGGGIMHGVSDSMGAGWQRQHGRGLAAVRKGEARGHNI
jgi:hypothetical protein